MTIPLSLSIVVEEVDVESGLDDAGDHRLPGEVGLDEVAVRPVEDVEGAVSAHGSDEISGQIFDFAGLLEHKELREDGDGLGPDGESPENFGDVEFVASKQREHGAGNKEELLMREIVDRTVVRLSYGRGRVEAHEVNEIGSRQDEDDLHD